MASLTGKSAVIAGGCSGIGYEIVKKFLNHGLQNVAILDICDTGNILQSLQSTYENQKVLFIQTDVSKKDQVKNAFDEIIKVFGYIDNVVGCAGILNETDYERMISVNLLGILHSTYTAIESMSKDKRGHGGVVINVSSLAGLEVYSIMPAYSASKHGIIGWQRCFSDEYYYEKHGIKFMTICPGPTETPILMDFDKKVNFGTLENYTFQPPTSVAQCVFEVLNLAKNGSIWIVDNGTTKEVISFNFETSPEVSIKND